jgi:hypothetical protein
MARLFLRPNELRRSSDRLEAALLAGLTALLAATVVLAVLLAAHLYRSAQAAAPAGLRLTNAVIDPPGAVTTEVFPHEARARVTWRLSDGAKRSGTLNTGLAPDLYGKPSGASVLVWLDSAGNPEPPPQDTADTVLAATLAAVGVTAGGVAVTATGYRLGRYALDRHRLAGWNSAWAVTGPRWTSRQ